MATIVWIDSFEAARVCGDHTIDRKPRKGEKQVHFRPMNNFHSYLSKGKRPPAHKRDGRKLLWNKARLEKEWASGEWPGRSPSKKKKADQRANADQPKANAPSVNEASAAQNLPQRAKSVKRDAEGLRHGSP